MFRLRILKILCVWIGLCWGGFAGACVAQAQPEIPKDFIQKIEKSQLESALQQVIAVQSAYSGAVADSFRLRQIKQMWGLWMAGYFNAKTNPPIQPPLTLVLPQIKEEALFNVFEKVGSGFIQFTLDGNSDQLSKINELYSYTVQRLEKTGRWQDLALVENQMGHLSYFINRLDQVEKHYLRAIAIAEEKGLQSLLANFYHIIANYYYGHLQDMEKAEMYYKKSLSREKQGVINYVALSDVYAGKGDWDRALEYGQRGIEIGLVPMYRALQHIKNSRIYLQQGQHSLAKKELLRADTILLQHKHTTDGLTQHTKGNWVLAAIAHQQQAGGSEWDSLYTNTETYMQHVHPSESVSAYIDICGFLNNNISNHIINEYAENPTIPSENKIQRAFGDYFLQQKDYDRALHHLDKGLALLGINQKQEVIKTNNDRDALRLLHSKLRVLLAKRVANRQAVSAQQIYDQSLQAIAVLDKMRHQLTSKGAKEHLLQQAPMIYEVALAAVWELYEQHPSDNWLEEAFYLSEKSRAMLLLDALQEDEARRFGGVPDSLRRQESALLADIAYCEAEVEQAKRQKDEEKIKRFNGYLFEKRGRLEQLKRALEAGYPAYFKLKYQTDIASVAQLQAQLPAGRVLLEYFVGASDYYIFAMSNERLWGVRKAITTTGIPLKKVINDWLSSVYDPEQLQNITAMQVQTYSKTAHTLYTALVADATRQFPAEQYPEWVIIPDGILSYLPFEILVTDAQTSGASYAQLPYWMRSAHISYHYSATLWGQGLQPKESRQGILGIAARYALPDRPIRRDEGWLAMRRHMTELHGAREEVETLGAVFGGKYLMDEEATEARFLEYADGYGILHFAVHGIVNGQSPARSGLVFTEDGDTSHDNVLMAYELPNLRLHADMVVLSACETARGKYQSGEGVMSLGRGFMYAGVNAVVMTLWSVNDIASQQLMRAFYGYLQQGWNKDKALRQAKLDYLEQAQGANAHPFFWSGYVVVGNTAASTTLSGGRGWGWWIGIGALVGGLGAGWGLRERAKGRRGSGGAQH